jgi:type IV secretory pathway TraG/TraD family ATPase VirD4
MHRVRIIKKLDERFTPWDISADITTETDAYEFAEMLFPKNERASSPYFNDTARSLVAGVVKRFQYESSKTGAPKPKAWTLRDVILAFESIARLENTLNHPKTRYLMDHFSPDNAKNFAGVKSTADTELGKYRSVAALLDSSENEAISLNDWVENQENVLVLGNHEKAREATDTLNRLILQHLSKALISREVSDPETNETWIFLDELREAGPLKGFRQLLLRGRSKGVSVAMGFQDVEGIFATYGDHEGAEIIGAAQNTLVLHINPSAPKTAQWTSDVFSSRRDEVPSTSSSGGDKGVSWGQQRSAQLVPNVYPIQFVELPMPSPAAGLNFYSFTNNDGYRCFKYPWPEFLQKEGYFRFIDRKSYPDFQLQREPEAYCVRPWDARDYSRLGIPAVWQASTSPPFDATVLLQDALHISRVDAGRAHEQNQVWKNSSRVTAQMR